MSRPNPGEALLRWILSCRTYEQLDTIRAFVRRRWQGKDKWAAVEWAIEARHAEIVTQHIHRPPQITITH